MPSEGEMVTDESDNEPVSDSRDNPFNSEFVQPDDVANDDLARQILAGEVLEARDRAQASSDEMENARFVEEQVPVTTDEALADPCGPLALVRVSKTPVFQQAIRNTQKGHMLLTGPPSHDEYRGYFEKFICLLNGEEPTEITDNHDNFRNEEFWTAIALWPELNADTQHQIANVVDNALNIELPEAPKITELDPKYQEKLDEAVKAKSKKMQKNSATDQAKKLREYEKRTKKNLLAQMNKESVRRKIDDERCLQTTRKQLQQLLVKHDEGEIRLVSSALRNIKSKLAYIEGIFTDTVDNEDFVVSDTDKKATKQLSQAQYRKNQRQTQGPSNPATGKFNQIPTDDLACQREVGKRGVRIEKRKILDHCPNRTAGLVVTVPLAPLITNADIALAEWSVTIDHAFLQRTIGIIPPEHELYGVVKTILDMARDTCRWWNGLQFSTLCVPTIHKQEWKEAKKRPRDPKTATNQEKKKTSSSLVVRAEPDKHFANFAALKQEYDRLMEEFALPQVLVSQAEGNTDVLCPENRQHSTGPRDGKKSVLWTINHLLLPGDSIYEDDGDGHKTEKKIGLNHPNIHMWMCLGHLGTEVPKYLGRACFFFQATTTDKEEVFFLKKIMLLLDLIIRIMSVFGEDGYLYTQISYKINEFDPGKFTFRLKLPVEFVYVHEKLHETTDEMNEPIKCVVIQTSGGLAAVWGFHLVVLVPVQEDSSDEDSSDEDGKKSEENDSSDEANLVVTDEDESSSSDDRNWKQPRKIVKRKCIRKNMAPQQQPDKGKGKKEDAYENVCCFCQTLESTHAIVPCGHKCLCDECEKHFSSLCPICRGNIQMKIKIYG